MGGLNLTKTKSQEHIYIDRVRKHFWCITPDGSFIGPYQNIQEAMDELDRCVKFLGEYLSEDIFEEKIK